MGARGPISRVERAAAVLPACQDVGPLAAPEGLGEAGQALWLSVFDFCPWIAEADAPAIADLARLADQMKTLREAIEREGVLIEEPIVTPRGEVVGTRFVPNPALLSMRKAEASALALRRAFGLTSTDRVRLGLDVQRLRKGETSTGDARALAFLKELGGDDD